MRRIFAILSLLPALGWAGGPRLDQWRIVGPGGGGALFFPTISPHDPSRVLVRCDMTGSYLSDDAGASWRMINLRGPASFYAFDPGDADTIYIYGLGLWRSTDAGQSWDLVYPRPDTVTGTLIAGDHGDESIMVAGSRPPAMTALTVDPGDSRTLYAIIGGALQISTDWGATWTRIASFSDGARQIYVDPRSPAGDRTIYVPGNHTIAVRESGVWRQGAAPAGVSAFTDVALGFPQDGPAVVYAVADRILISEDGGASWRDSNLPGTRTQFAAVGVSFLHPDAVYVSYSNLTEPDGRYWFGVARSGDRGHTWDLSWKSGNQSPANVADAWIPAAFGAGWAGNPRNLGVAPTDANIVYGTDDGRAMRTLDGGQTWQAVYSTAMSGGGFNTIGMDITTNYGIHFDPFDAARRFITYTDIGLFRSEDGGSSWLYSGAGVPTAWRNTTYWIESDPDVPGRMWAATSQTHDLPRPKMWRSSPVSSFNGGVVASKDGGRTWTKSNDGMQGTATTHILLDPASPPDARVLYAAGFGVGVYKSLDGGQSWTLKNNGIDGSQPFVWRFTLDVNGVLYAVVARRSEDGSFGNPGDGAVYRSTDAAETWAKLSLPSGVNGPNGLTVDPDDPDRLYLAAWGRYNRTGDVDGGIYVSTDAGATWRNVLSADQHIYDVTADARTGTLYAAGFESSAWRSDDRGESWQRIQGFNFKWGHRVIPDPQDPAQIYITTFGGSVWHGPAAGDPNSSEDIAAPMPLRFTR